MPPVMDRKASRARAEQAWRLRLRGRTWQEIADQLDYKSRGAATRAVKDFLKRNPPDDIDVMRRAAGDTLAMVIDKVLDSLDAAQKKGDHRGVAELGRVVMDGVDKRAKLEGLHIAVPQQVELNVHQSPAEVIASTRERLLAALQSEQQNALPAPDIVDAEIVETPEQETA